MANVQDLVDKENRGEVLTPQEKREIVAAIYRGEIPNNRGQEEKQMAATQADIPEFHRTEGYRKAMNKLLQAPSPEVAPEPQQISDDEFKQLQQEFQQSQEAEQQNMMNSGNKFKKIRKVLGQ